MIRMIKLLLVEDEKRMNEALAELLRQEGYAVDAMSNGADGMTAIVENAYHSEWHAADHGNQLGAGA